MRKMGEGDGHARDVGEAGTSMGFGEKGAKAIINKPRQRRIDSQPELSKNSEKTKDPKLRRWPYLSPPTDSGVLCSPPSPDPSFTVSSVPLLFPAQNSTRSPLSFLFSFSPSFSSFLLKPPSASQPVPCPICRPNSASPAASEPPNTALPSCRASGK